MKHKILVTYASRARSTQTVAQAIGEELVKQGGEVDMHFILDVHDVSNYDIVVIGSAVRGGQWLPEAVRFVKIHQKQLRQRKVAYFLVCMTLREDTQENRDKMLTAFNQVRDWVKPIDIGLFAGALDSRKLKFLWRMVAKLLRFPDGDFRNFHAIRAWAEQLAEKLHLGEEITK